MAATTHKILIVDDSATDRELISSMLHPTFSTLEAKNVETGLDAFRREHPDCVLLDNDMPGGSGIDGLIDFVRERAVVVMVSGSDSEELAAEAIKRGAHDFLRKDQLTKPTLLRTITRERERRLLKDTLDSTQQRFDEVAARIQEVLWVRSLDGEFLYLSPAFERVWGLPRTGMSLAIWEQHVHAEDRELGQIARDSLTAGREYELDYRIVRPDGSIRRIRNSGYPIFEGGVLTRYGGITRDITEETRLHQELRLAQKLEAIGQLAAGVAHEINTPTQYVSDNVAFLTQAFGELQPLLTECRDLLRRNDIPATLAGLREAATAADLEYLATELPTALEQTAAGIGQIARIVKAMKEFAHPTEDFKTVDINHAIETTVTVAKNEWKYVADVQLDLAPELTLIACNPSEINQVLLNLIVNAAHAIEATIGGDRDRKGEIKISTLADGGYVEIAIADNGCGIPEAIHDRIFDPFFTTKEIGKGTGQGLAIAHRIVTERHGGSIRFESTVGRGTCFFVRLPFGGITDERT